MASDEKVKLELELSDDDVANLRVLATSWAVKDDAQIVDVLKHLLVCVDEGVSRGGSWERGWLLQAFGDEWTERLELDPDGWHTRAPK